MSRAKDLNRCLHPPPSRSVSPKMVATAGSGQHALSQRRSQLAGPSGVKGLLSNLRIFAIAVFASLGGFVYGCEFALIFFPSIVEIST